VQSYLPSQTRFLEMQSPFEQVACCSPQAVGGRVGVGIPGYKNVHVQITLLTTYLIHAYAVLRETYHEHK
jgi:hypothetical protein